MILEHKSWDHMLASATSPNNEETITYAIPPPLDIPVISFVPIVVVDCTLVPTATIHHNRHCNNGHIHKDINLGHEETNVAMVT